MGKSENSVTKNCSRLSDLSGNSSIQFQSKRFAHHFQPVLWPGGTREEPMHNLLIFKKNGTILESLNSFLVRVIVRYLYVHTMNWHYPGTRVPGYPDSGTSYSLCPHTSAYTLHVLVGKSFLKIERNASTTLLLKNVSSINTKQLRSGWTPFQKCFCAYDSIMSIMTTCHYITRGVPGTGIML